MSVHIRRHGRTALAALFVAGLVLPHAAEARPGFGGRGAFMNMGGHFHPNAGFRPAFHPGPHPEPGPRPGPHPHPGPPPPGPHPGPGPHPHPPGPPHPPPYPYHPGYWPYPDAWAWGAAAVTAAAIGSMVYSLPASCVAVRVNNVTYEHCGSTWYQPRYSGSHIVYVVVNPPR